MDIHITQFFLCNMKTSTLSELHIHVQLGTLLTKYVIGLAQIDIKEKENNKANKLTRQ